MGGGRGGGRHVVMLEKTRINEHWLKKASRRRQTRRHVRKNSHQRALVKKSIRTHQPPGKNTKMSVPEAGHDVARTRLVPEPAVGCHGRR